MNRWQAVVFDLDDTLYPERDFVLSGFRAVARWGESRLGIPADAGYDELRGLYESGVRGETFNHWLGQHGVDAAPLVPEIVDVYRQHEPSLRPFPCVPGLLARLRRDHRVGLVGDGYRDVQERKLNALGIRHLFDAVVFSDEWGRHAWKPSTAPFVAVLEQLGVTAASTVYVADNPNKDFIGARRTGIHTIQLLRPDGEYAGSAAPTPDHAASHVINDLAELEGILEQ